MVFDFDATDPTDTEEVGTAATSTVEPPKTEQPIEVEVEATRDDDTAPAEATTEESTAVEQTADVPPEVELVDQLWAAYRSQLDASLKQQAASLKLEKAQAEYDVAVELTATRKSEVAELLSSFLARLAEIRDPQSAAIVEAIQADMDAQQPVSEPTAAMDYDTWRKLPTQEIVDIGIVGLGDKKAAALMEKFPTLGDLEDARAEAGKAHTHFCKQLVKGIGEKTADAIENAMSDLLLGQGSKKPAKPAEAKPAEVKPEAEATDDEPTEPTEAASESSPEPVGDGPTLDASDSQDADIDVDIDADDEDEVPWEDPTQDDDVIYSDADADDDDTVDSWAEDYHLAILESKAEQKTGWGANQAKHSVAWDEGYNAQEDWPVDACKYDHETDLELAKEWVRGWTAANQLQFDL